MLRATHEVYFGEFLRNAFLHYHAISGLFFSKDVNHRLAKRPMVFNGRLGNRGLTSLVKEATGSSTAVENFEQGGFEFVQLLWSHHNSNSRLFTFQILHPTT